MPGGGACAISHEELDPVATSMPHPDGRSIVLRLLLGGLDSGTILCPQFLEPMFGGGTRATPLESVDPVPRLASPPRWGTEDTGTLSAPPL